MIIDVQRRLAAVLFGMWLVFFIGCDKSPPPAKPVPSTPTNTSDSTGNAAPSKPAKPDKTDEPVLAGVGTIKGKVVFDGDPPGPKRISMAGNAQCANVHKQNNNVDSKGRPKVADPGQIVYAKQSNTIPFVFVYIKEGIKKRYDPPKEPVVLDQVGCMYKPHVFGMIAGQGLDIRSSDPFTHNVHSLAKKNPGWNFSQPKPGLKEMRGNDTFTRQEIMIKIKCDVHGWMSSYCGVLYHPFFDVTKDHIEYPSSVAGNKEKWGTFEIKDVPAGNYVLEAWHEKFGTATMEVTLSGDETKEIEFKLGGS
ncbi:MAG: carboxypeptidase-like regulatory domain-containing protein [Phycisphaerales bacterium]|nr:carboxypeptidase-like regulatory domain-containing protein [Phycisphaerales bacterium]